MFIKYTRMVKDRCPEAKSLLCNQSASKRRRCMRPEPGDVTCPGWREALSHCKPEFRHPFINIKETLSWQADAMVYDFVKRADGNV
jgi:hypothetical protein